MTEYFWYSLLSTEKIGYKKFYYIHNKILTKSLNINDIISMTVEDFSHEFNIDITLSSDFINKFKSKKNENDYIRFKLMRANILLSSNNFYPDKIKFKYPYPPPLYVIGDKSLMNRPSIGISGSRKAIKSSLDDAYYLVKEALKQKLTVISGFAKGVDEIATQSAFLNDGSAIVVLPSGLNTYDKYKINCIIDETVCIVSMFKPDTVFSKWCAFERNKLIAFLSDMIFIIEAHSPSGSLMQGKLGLNTGKPIFVFDKDFEGNKILIKSGAIAVNRSNISSVFKCIDFYYPFINFSKQKFEVTELWKIKQI